MGPTYFFYAYRNRCSGQTQIHSHAAAAGPGQIWKLLREPQPDSPGFPEEGTQGLQRQRNDYLLEISGETTLGRITEKQCG